MKQTKRHKLKNAYIFHIYLIWNGCLRIDADNQLYEQMQHCFDASMLTTISSRVFFLIFETWDFIAVILAHRTGRLFSFLRSLSTLMPTLSLDRWRAVLWVLFDWFKTPRLWLWVSNLLLHLSSLSLLSFLFISLVCVSMVVWPWLIVVYRGILGRCRQGINI